MLFIPNFSRHATIVIGMGVLFLFLTVISGCTQQVPGFSAATPQPTPAPNVLVTKPDATHIVIRYQGGADMEKLIEIEATVTDSGGKSSTQHIGDKLSTSPINIGGTIKFEGSYAGTNKVYATGYYIDGSSRNLLSTTI